MTNPRFWVEIALALSMLVTPIALLIHRTIAKKSGGESFGMGVRQVQFLGASLLVPGLFILALERVIDGCTVAALAGAFVGYLFSGIVEFDRRKSDD